MAYVDHAFSITDEYMMMEPAYAVHNRPPVKKIALAVSLLVFGILGIVFGIFMLTTESEATDLTSVICDTRLDSLFSGFYYTRIAYYTYKGYKGFSFSNIPPD